MNNALEYLENSTRLYPEKTVVIDDNTSCTYMELSIVARKLGTYISDRTDTGKSIALFMDKGVLTMQAFMAVVYSGCYYTLVDPSFPIDRTNQILGILESRVIITTSKYESKLLEVLSCSEFKNKDIVVINLDNLDINSITINEGKLATIRKKSKDTDILYCNFTSGSTGVPKGVLISHRAVISFIDNFTKAVGIEHQDVIGNQAPFDFDVSVKDMYSTLKCGATMVIIPKSYFMFPNRVVDMLDKYKVTTLIWAVSALVMLNRLHALRYKAPSSINKIMFSGEMMPIKQLNAWKKYYPDAKYINLYGPTEITCNCTYHILDRDYELDEKIPMGRAFNHCKVYLISKEGREITSDMVGVSGEVCVAGESLATMYCNNEVATKKAFTTNPIEGLEYERIYHTGDMACYGSDGHMYFAGRADFQIKHMGHRIELEEIEKVLGNVDEVEQACCFFDERKNRVVAYYVGLDNKKAIISNMKKKVPDYMVPNVYRRIERMPINKNGKTDRKLLKQIYLDGVK